MELNEVQRQGRLLRDYAEHFVQHDWDWTRDHKLHRVLYRNQRVQRRDGTVRRLDPSRLPYRVQQAFQGLWRDVRRDPSTLDTMIGRISPWRMFRARLRENNLPDGVLDNGGIIVYWEETGEYIQKMQPSVGSLVADLLEQDPENPHAQAIARELARIAARYHERLEL